MKVIVIGGGPAGMMASIKATEKADVILIEKNDILGKKLLITGKGRCNITNAVDISEFVNNIPCNGNFMYSALYTFTNEMLIHFLNDLGLKTKVERGQRVFPVSDKSLDVLNTLKRCAIDKGVKIYSNESVKAVLVNEHNEVIAVKTDRNTINCDKVILATGGKSYPKTGSTGDGYIIAKQLGHTIIEPKPSLVPLVTKEVYNVQGLSLKNVGIKIMDIINNKKIYEDFGEMLFTHFGISGPIILSASSYLVRYKDIKEKMKNGGIKIYIDFKPALTNEVLFERIRRDFEKYKNKMFKHGLDDLLPKKMIPIILELSKINEDKKMCDISNKEVDIIVDLFKKFELTVEDFRPIEEAIVTSGGINTKEINPSTMESKIIKGLYFAGEIIDVDAYTGGFNLQSAFSTGYLAGSLE